MACAQSTRIRSTRICWPLFSQRKRRQVLAPARHSRRTDAKRPASAYDLKERVAMTARNGSADWHGDVRTGSGTITVGDGVFSGPYSYDSRFGEHQGTNPEQLIAAAQAGCFTMAFASKLASGGHPPDLLRTNATVHLRMHEGSITLARLEIETEGRVKDIDEQQFVRYAEDAKATCPVARALSGIPEIVLKAMLTEGA